MTQAARRRAARRRTGGGGRRAEGLPAANALSAATVRTVNANASNPQIDDSPTAAMERSTPPARRGTGRRKGREHDDHRDPVAERALLGQAANG